MSPAFSDTNDYEIGCGNEETPPCDPAGGIFDCESCQLFCPDGNSDDEGTDSVKPYRANKKRHVTDLMVYGASPIPFTRIYNSRTVDFTTNYMEFGWKQTWQHNWNYEMRDQSSTTLGQRNIKLRYSNGSEFNFYAVETNGAVIRAPYAHNGDRLHEWGGSTVGHTLVTSGGWEYDFQRTTYPRYQLLRVRNGQGASWDLSYDEHGRIQRIENNFGRWLEIQRTNLNGSLCISGVQSSDGREVVYGYDVWQYTNIVTTSGPVEICDYEWVEHEGGEYSYDYVCRNVWTTIVTVTKYSNNVLSSAYYPDGHQAAYTYVGAESLTNGRPLLASADDPCVSGPGARIVLEYNYDAILDFGSGPYLVTGTFLGQRNMDTSETVLRMPLGAGDYPQVLRGDGIEVTHKYTNGLLREKRDAENRVKTYTRDQDGYGFVSAISDAESNTTGFVRDYAGRILQEIDPLGQTNCLSYNEAGYLVSNTDRMGRVTAYTRDTHNWLTRVDYPDGSYEEWTRNEHGQPLTHRLQNGGIVAYEYYGTNEVGGALGDLKAVTDPMGHVTSYAWDSAGLPAAVTDARSNTTAFLYDWRGRLQAITNADGTSTSYQYDAYGNRTNMTDELGRSTALTYDQYNRLHTICDPLGRTTTYEYGLLPGCSSCGVFDQTITRIIDPAGKVTEYAYDLSGKRTNEVIAAGTPDASATAWTYDAVGRRRTQLDANSNLHTWFYDAAGRMVAESNAAAEVTTYAYDAAGNLTNRVDGADVETSLEYDALNRPIAMGSGNLRYEYAYDLGGRRTSVFTRVEGDVVEATALDYDLNDRLVAKADPTGHVLAYAYDPVGNRASLAVSNVLSISYAYDARNRLTEIVGNGKTTQFGYDAASHRTNAVWPNGTYAAYAYDDAGQLLSLIHGRANPPGEPLASFTYAYDLSGHRTNMVTLEGTHSYAYDARGQLTAVTYPDGSAETFAYDPVGNRTSLVQAALSGPGIETIYAYGPANRLLFSESAVETNVYAFDDAGRLVGQTVYSAGGGAGGLTRAYGYDFQSRMTSLTDTNGSVFSYAFDGEGNRIRQSLNNCLYTRFVYDGANAVMEMSAEGGSAYGGNVSNEVVWAWVNGPGVDQPVERIGFINGTPRNRQVIHADGLGSVAALTDESGATVQTYAYAAFGGVREQTGTDLNRVTFTAREALGDSLGFYYYRHRIYDPNTGRFTSEDPLGFVDGPNRYIYCVNNPLLFLDPFGREKDEYCQNMDKLIEAAKNGDLAEYADNLPGYHPVKDISLPPLKWFTSYDPYGFDGANFALFVVSLTYYLCGFEYTIPTYYEYTPIGPSGP